MPSLAFVFDITLRKNIPAISQENEPFLKRLEVTKQVKKLLEHKGR